MAEIRFTTVADLKGIHDLESALDRLHDRARSIAATMKQFGAFESQGIAEAIGTPSGLRPMSGPRPRTPHPMQTPRAIGGATPATGGKSAKYDLSTQGGVIEYYDNVLAQTLPMLNAMRPASAGLSAHTGPSARLRSTLQNVPGMTPVLGSAFKSKHLPGSTPYYEDWFNRIGQPDAQSMMSKELRQAYAEAQDLWLGGRSITPAEFYQNYSSEANQPAPKPPSFWQRFRQHARGGSIGAQLSSGLRGAMIGGAASRMLGSGAGGSALLDGAIGGGAATLLEGGGLASLFNPELLPLLAIPMIASVFKSGYNNWQQTAPTSSQIAHSLGTVGQGANALNLSIQKAAAAFGVMGSTALQSAQTLVQAFGGNDATTASLTAQAAKFAMVNGLSDQTQTQLMTALGTMGVTSGIGSTLTPYEGNRMLTQLAQVSHMQGRQGPLFTGLSSIYSTLASINPTISNPLGVAGQYAAMNASGIQGLQGLRGAQLVSQMDSSLANSKGFGQLMMFSAIEKASGGKIKNPFQMMSIGEQGAAAFIPGTHTTLGTAINQLVGGLGGNQYTQASIFGSIMGLDLNQSLAVRKSGMLNAPALRVPKGKLNIPKSLADTHAIAAALNAYEKAKTGQTGGVVSTFGNQASFEGLKALFHLPKDPTAAWNAVHGALTSAWKQFGSVASGSYLNHPWQQMVPYAEEVSKKTGYPASYLLSQWMLESTWGTSPAARQNENLAGIKPTAAHPAGPDAKYAGFSSLAQFAKADAALLNSPRYAHARALAQHGASAQAVFSALASEGYTGSPTPAQAEQYGKSIEGMMQSMERAVERAMARVMAQHRNAEHAYQRAQTAHAQTAARGPAR